MTKRGINLVDRFHWSHKKKKKPDEHSAEGSLSVPFVTFWHLWSKLATVTFFKPIYGFVAITKAVTWLR
jgi:hypothetical protein